MEVPGVRLSDSGMEHLSIDINLQVVDLGVGALRALTPLSLVPEREDQGLTGLGEDMDIIPDPSMLVEMVREWLAVQSGQRAACTLRKREGSSWTRK